jgi:hypothetical protein
MTSILHRRSAALPLACALAAALHLVACANDSAPAPVADALSPDDLNLVFVVTPDLAYQTPGDVSPATGNLTSQGLQRSLKLATYLKHQVLGDRNVTRIYGLQPMTHLQTADQYPDMAALAYIQQFAMLNQISLTGGAGYNSPLYTANSSPLNASPIDPDSEGYALAYQGLEFADASGHNLLLAETILYSNPPGFYVFAAPWETVSALLTALDARGHLGLAVPATYGGSNRVLALSVKVSGGATLTSFDAALQPPATYPALPSPVASVACPSATSNPQLFSLPAPNGVAGASVPPGVNRNQTLYMIRHAEAHPWSNWDDGNFVAAGQWRALAMADALRGKISPTMVWSNDPAQAYPGGSFVPGGADFSYVRPSLTVAPYAIANDLPYRLVSDFQVFSANSPADTAAFFFFGGRFSNTTMLMAWEHLHIPATVTALLQAYFPPGAVPPTPDWPGADYDTIWTVRLDAAGNLTIDNALCEGIDSSKLPATAPPY